MKFETEDTELIVCPNCGEEVDDSHDLFIECQTKITLDCLECGQRIKAELETVIKRSYTSYKTQKE